MRQHNKYLIKVEDEMDIYRKHVMEGAELTEQQSKTFEKVDIVRGWLRDGFSDIDVIKLAKSDPRLCLMDRRAREVLAMAYSIFADLRQIRDQEGIKYMYSEQFRKMGRLIMIKIYALAQLPDDEDLSMEELEELKLTLNATNAKEMSLLMKEYTRVMKEAAIIDGAYNTGKAPGAQKPKPTKIIIKRKTVIKDGQVKSDNLTEKAEYELGE